MTLYTLHFLILHKNNVFIVLFIATTNFY